MYLSTWIWVKSPPTSSTQHYSNSTKHIFQSFLHQTVFPNSPSSSTIYSDVNLKSKSFCQILIYIWKETIINFFVFFYFSDQNLFKIYFAQASNQQSSIASSDLPNTFSTNSQKAKSRFRPIRNAKSISTESSAFSIHHRVPRFEKNSGSFKRHWPTFLRRTTTKTLPTSCCWRTSTSVPSVSSSWVILSTFSSVREDTSSAPLVFQTWNLVLSVETTSKESLHNVLGKMKRSPIGSRRCFSTSLRK